MRALLVTLACAAGAHADDEPVAVLIAADSEVYLGATARVVVIVGVKRDALENRLVQMFQRELDVPVRVSVPWLRKLAGAKVTLRTEDGERTIGVNDDFIEAAVYEDTPEILGVAVVVDIEPLRPGPLVLAAPEARYMTATKFRDDFLRGRVPVDRQDAVAKGEPFTITVRELPNDGRPEGFTGAVGDFNVKAEASATEVEVGATFKVTLDIEGDGNMTSFTPPPFRHDGFHVYGILERKTATWRDVTYEVAVLRDDVTAVPALVFPFFHPETGTYRTAKTKPIPLTVRSVGPGPAPAREEPTEPEAPASNWWIFAVAGAGVVLALAVRLRIRARPAPEVPPLIRFHERAQTDPAGAFAEYLAARLGCAPAAVIGPDLEARLEASGAPADLAARAAALMERLVAARYGGVPSDTDLDEAQAIVSTLDRG